MHPTPDTKVTLQEKVTSAHHRQSRPIRGAIVGGTHELGYNKVILFCMCKGSKALSAPTTITDTTVEVLQGDLTEAVQ